MTFEVGKEYPTRGGGTAKVIEDDGTEFPLNVAHEDGVEIWHYPDGSEYKNRESFYDLIAPAVEPEAPAPAAKTLRDEFAMAALMGMASTYNGQAFDPHGTSGAAYEFADAMLAARAQGGAA